MHHGEGLRRLLTAKRVPPPDQDALLTALESDLSGGGLSGADREMLRYADRLTGTPGEVTAADVDRLREHGFDDRAIHDICAIAAYYAFVNRIADGLGVELEHPR